MLQLIIFFNEEIQTPAKNAPKIIALTEYEVFFININESYT